MQWQRLAIPELELSLARVLRCGQTFRWKCINNVWTFALDDRIVLLRQTPGHLEFAHVLLRPGVRAGRTAEFVRDYFNLSVDLAALYAHWQARHVLHHRTPAKALPFHAFPGIRILRQDPWETTVSFICSSNNNVKRISAMCENLCVHFGAYVGEYEGIKHYSFPAPHHLQAPDVEARLRGLGFGYRARYIHHTACMMASPENVQVSRQRLDQMRELDYDTAHDFLLRLTGVGPKVADCICLMALDKHDIVPVDTHVYQIAIREYRYPGSASVKTMNKAVYSGIRAYFRDLFGPYAGWAQLVLFASDLSDLINGQNVSDQGVVESVIKRENIKPEVVKSVIKQEVVESVIKSEVVKSAIKQKTITSAIKQKVKRERPDHSEIPIKRESIQSPPRKKAKTSVSDPAHPYPIVRRSPRRKLKV